MSNMDTHTIAIWMGVIVFSLVMFFLSFIGLLIADDMRGYFIVIFLVLQSIFGALVYIVLLLDHYLNKK